MKPAPPPHGSSCPRTWSFAGVAWLVLVAHLFLSPLLFSNETAESVESVKVALLLGAGIVLTALGACAWIARSDRHEAMWQGLRALRKDPVGLGVVLFLVSATLSTVFS